MILTVTCNPAIDVTYTVDSLTPGEVHRVTSVVERPGGKGVNVARVLRQLGERSTATGFGNPSFDASLEAWGVHAAFVPVLPKVRRTLVVRAPAETTSLWEPGADVEAGGAEALERQVTMLLATATALVVSGSLPGGVDPSLPARLARVARDKGLPVVLDLDDEPLRLAAEGSGAVLVPNGEELARLAGSHDIDVVAAAHELSECSGAPVVTTLGEDGMVAVDGPDAWHAEVPEQVVDGNPTGAGDSAAAAIARGLVRRRSWPEILADAVALSASTVLTPVAGEVDVDAYQKWRTQVVVHWVETLPVRR